jgi:hypothetical protein
MRKLVALPVLGLVLLVVLLPATPGRAADRICVPGEPHSCAVGNQPFDLPVSRCGFPISVGVVSDREYVIHDTFLPDGTEIERITGELVLSFANTVTGKTVIENVSGPSTSTFAPNGSGSFEGQGRNWLSFGPGGQANTREPGLVFTDGDVVVGFSGNVATSFSLSGTQVDGCALLG